MTSRDLISEVKNMKYKIVLTALLFLIMAAVPFAQGQKLTAEEIIAKHLDSIAPAEKRSTVKSLIAVGDVRVDFVTQKSQPATGRVVIASEGNKLLAGMSLNASDYPQEKIIFDGDKTSVAMVRSGSRTVLGNFIQANSWIVSQGLLSGTLGTSWLLLNTAERKPKISTTGTKKIDGQEVYGLSFSPKGGGDLDITMYFDKETFRHVRTEYKRTSSASMGRTPDESARQSETHLKVVEDFSDFKVYEGLTLPNTYKISYSITGASTTEIQWTCKLTEFAVNQKLDANTFDAGK
jgi:hypothetical protein